MSIDPDASSAKSGRDSFPSDACFDSRVSKSGFRYNASVKRTPTHRHARTRSLTPCALFSDHKSLAALTLSSSDSPAAAAATAASALAVDPRLIRTGNARFESHTKKTAAEERGMRKRKGLPFMQALGFTSDDPSVRITREGKQEFLQSLSE